MTRAFFLWLSQRAGIRRWMETHAVARKLTRRFVAGETVDDLLAVCEEMAARGIHTTADHLGENVATLAEATAARDEYLALLGHIEQRKLPSTISLKLTALGFDLSQDAALEHLRTIAQRAASIGSRVEVDMEDTRYTQRTVEFAETVGRETGCIRVCLQAYLYRTPKDIERLNAAKVMVRLCKGAYIEPASEAMPKKSDVDRAYLTLAKTLLEHGTLPALATHDERMIQGILEHAKSFGNPAYEFEMLHGIRRDLQQKLAQEGHSVRVYVPYGAAWYRYFMRRLAERPANVWFLLRNLLRA